MLAVSEGHRISGQPNRVGGGRRFSNSAAGQSINNSNRSGSGAAIPGNNLDASSKLTDYSNSNREGGGADGLDVSSKLSESFSTRDGGGSRSGGTTSSKSGAYLLCLFICMLLVGGGDLIGWRRGFNRWRWGFGMGLYLI